MEKNQKEWKIENDEVLLYTPLLQYGNGIYQITPIISKEVFVECYKKWIKEDNKNDF